MYNGDPVPGAMVGFHAEGAPFAATGVTNDKGEFKLSMYGANDGAIPGTHQVTVTKMEGGTATGPDPKAALSDPTALTGQMASGAPAAPKSLVPEKYGNAGTTPLSKVVEAEGENQFVLQLAD